MKRSMIRELVEQHLLQEVSIAKLKHPFKAFLMTGPAGAGKTFVSKNLLDIPAEARKYNLNPDDIIEDLFPKFDVTLKFAHGKKDPLAAAQKELRDIAKVGTMSKAVGYINRAKPLFIDTTGQDVARLAKTLDTLVRLGYDVGIIKVFVPKKTSVGRDTDRERTVGEEKTGEIWDIYKKNVIDGEGYDKYAEGNPHVTVLNPEAFWNVYNLGDEEVVIDDKLIAKARDKVEDVEGSIPVTIAEMDRVIADLKKATSDFLAPREINNPTGKCLYHGMLALMKASKGRLGQEITDLYEIGMEEPEFVERSPEIAKAIQCLGDVTGVPDLKKSFEEFKELVKKASRGKEEKDITVSTGSRVIDKMKGFYPTGDDDDDDDDYRTQMVAEAIAKRLAEKLKIK